MTNKRSFQYSNIIGIKFNEDGSPRRYPGNTIICSIESGSALHKTLVELQCSLKSAPYADSFSFLPSSSFHMTLARGVNDQLRLPNEWPRDLALDMELQEVTAIFCSRLTNVSIPGCFVMCPIKLGNGESGESQLFLDPLNDLESSKIAIARQSLRHALKHSRSGDEKYAFHITFSYQIKHLTSAQTKEMRQLNATLFQRFFDKLHPVKVWRPTLSTYENMLDFTPIFTLSN